MMAYWIRKYQDIVSLERRDFTEIFLDDILFRYVLRIANVNLASRARDLLNSDLVSIPPHLGDT